MFRHLGLNAFNVMRLSNFFIVDSHTPVIKSISRVSRTVRAAQRDIATDYKFT